MKCPRCGVENFYQGFYGSGECASEKCALFSADHKKAIEPLTSSITTPKIKPGFWNPLKEEKPKKANLDYLDSRIFYRKFDDCFQDDPCMKLNCISCRGGPDGGGPDGEEFKILSNDTKKVRAPQKPEELVGALHDRVHRKTGTGRAAKSVRIRRIG